MDRQERYKKIRDWAHGIQNVEQFKDYIEPKKENMSIEKNLEAAGVKLFQHNINDAGTSLEGEDRPEFAMMAKYCNGLGLDFGSGSNRLSPTVLSVDRHKEPGVDLVWDVLYMGQLPFSDETFDFVFTSHVLEDFHPDTVQAVFDELLRLIKRGGCLITIGPDMGNGRYPKWDEKFTAESPEVVRGERQIGETIGNPSHLFDWSLEFCHQLKNNSRYQTEVICEDTIPHTTCSIDFVVKKL